MQTGGTTEQDHREPSGARWTVRDVIDFEWLIDREAPVADRAVDPGHADRRTVFRLWLDRVRVHVASPSPGETYDRGLRLLRLFAVLMGMALGVVLAGTLLSHNDAEPINALLFFGGTAGLQLAVLLLVGIAWSLGKANVRVRPLQDVLLLVVGLFGRLLDRLDGARRTALQARWAALDLRSGRLAPLIGCQLLVVTQLFAIFFNIGLLAAMLLVYLPFVELRFGWQSTYSYGADGVAAWVQLVAAPWSWISSVLAPDAAQVAATQYTRGQHADTLPIAAAHAWWPFLLCAIVFYGLLIRLVLAGLATLVLRHRLAQPPFTHPAANALWRRLTGPLVVSHANDQRLPEPRLEARPHRTGSVHLLVVDDELGGRGDAVRVRVEGFFGGHVGPSIASSIDDDALRADVVAALASHDSVIVAIPAERDPLVAVADFVRALIAAARPATEITILLIDGGSARLEIWRRFVVIQRLRIGVEQGT